MNPVKRVGLAALLVVGMALFASTPARAGRPVNIYQCELENTGDEPEATGHAAVVDVKYKGVNADGDEVFWLKASVTCQHLTPHATYWTPVGTFTANGKGNGNVVGWVDIVVPADSQEDFVLFWLTYVVEVVRLDQDGNETTVLSAPPPPPWPYPW